MMRTPAIVISLLLALAAGVTLVISYAVFGDLGKLFSSGELLPWSYNRPVELPLGWSCGKVYTRGLDPPAVAGFSLRPGSIIWMTSDSYVDIGRSYRHGVFVSRCEHYNGRKDYAVRAPLILLLLLFLAYPIVVLLRSRARRNRRRKEGLCVKCGYNLTGNVSGVCSECGEKVLRGDRFDET